MLHFRSSRFSSIIEPSLRLRQACAVSAGEIIREIERLSSAEKAEVLRALLRSQPDKSKLSPDELVALADRMVAAKDPAKADRLKARILAGFDGR